MPSLKPAVAAAASAEAASAPMPIRDRPLNALQDLIDLRDHYYLPTLQTLRRQLPPETNLPILDQQGEGACTGFALAAAIELFKRHRLRREQLLDPNIEEEFPPLSGASPRMLYEMAKLHDEIQEVNQSGSTLRGVLKGFFHNGACSEGSAPYQPNPPAPWTLTLQSARDARALSLGAYYRLRPSMRDYHAALNETGAVIVSAHVHEGWRLPNMLAESQPVARQKNGVIKKREGTIGGHAFVVVGYDKDGFLVQNSWGTRWGGYEGRDGIGHWCYEDWAENIMDAWVLQLGVPTPAAFHLTHTLVRSNYLATQAGATASQARRQDVLGHLIHLDDGKLVQVGRYGTPLSSIEQTRDFLAGKTAALVIQQTDEVTKAGVSKKPVKARDKYDHILFFAHGGLAGPEVGARRIAAMREVFKRNRIYPIHFMWETGITEAVFDTLDVIYKKAVDRVGSRQEDLDRVIETMTRGLGSKVWRAIKADAARAFGHYVEDGEGDGYKAFITLLEANARLDNPYHIHFAGHSAGANLVGHCLERWAADTKQKHLVENCFLLAPACTVAFYNEHFLPLLEKGRVGRIVQYGLSEARELEDKQGRYGKSMLNLVSNAFEDTPDTPLLGLQRFHRKSTAEGFVPPHGHKVFFSGTVRDQDRTDARSHTGFASDIQTLNDMLKTIRGRKPKAQLAFAAADLVSLTSP